MVIVASVTTLPLAVKILPRIDDDVSSAIADVDNPNASTTAPVMRERR